MSILLGGDAGLRLGEMIALAWVDVDLATRSAPARAIQELAGHADLATTQRYMHLSPRAIESAIRLFD